MSEVLPLRPGGSFAQRMPLREVVPSGPRRDSLRSSEGVTPLRRPFGIKRRTHSGVAALIAAAAVRALVVVALPVGVIVWLLYSPYFLIREVKVDGGARVSAAWMQQNLDPLVGRHVLAVSLDGVRRRLSAHPWVASVELRRALPDRLRVSVVERRPVALLAVKDGLVFLDGQGLPIAPYEGGDSSARVGVGPGHPEGLIVVRCRFPGPVPVQAALDLVGELRRAQPAWGVGVREVELLGEGEYRVVTAALPYPLLLEAGTVGPAVTNLQLMLPQISRRVPAVGEADLRSPRRLVIRPAASPAGAAAEDNGSRTSTPEG